MTHESDPSCGAFLDIDWQPPAVAAAAPVHLRNLLTETGSLTARLRERCGPAFRVQLLAEARRPLDAREAALLGVSPASPGFLREVHLCCGERALVFACTLAPAAQLGGRDRWLAELGSGAVGDHVFSSEDGGREDLEIALIPPSAPLVRYAMRGAAPPDVPLWARRSRLHAGPLEFEVMECFLPGVDACIRESNES